MGNDEVSLVSDRQFQRLLLALPDGIGPLGACLADLERALALARDAGAPDVALVRVFPIFGTAGNVEVIWSDEEGPA